MWFTQSDVEVVGLKRSSQAVIDRRGVAGIYPLWGMAVPSILSRSSVSC